MSRERQLAFSSIVDVVLDEGHRRRKAAKMLAVVQHFLGRDDLDGMSVLDVGCSAGFVCDEFARRGARAVGVDIDVPSLTVAAKRFGKAILFLQADGERLPLPPRSFDIVLVNHVYEHVVDPDALLAEIRRVLAPGGLIYLGLANRFWFLEPHYNLLFLSWLPPRVADRYIRLFRRSDRYHERLRSRSGLQRLVSGLIVWEYTFSMLADPGRFVADDLVPAPLRRLPPQAWRSLTWFLPTYLWVATDGPSRPQGEPLRIPPHHLKLK